MTAMTMMAIDNDKGNLDVDNDNDDDGSENPRTCKERRVPEFSLR